MSSRKDAAIADCVRFIIFRAGDHKPISKNMLKAKVLDKHGIKLDVILPELNQELRKVRFNEEE